MENNFNRNDELEQYLKDEAEGHKMYPSEYVWENIRTEIHGNPSWPALTFIAIAIILSLTVSTLFNYPPKTIITKTNTIVQKLDNVITDASAETENITKTESFDQQINPNNYTAVTLAAINDKNTIDAYIASTQDLVNQKRVAIPTDIIEQSKSSFNYVSAAVSKPILFSDGALFYDDMQTDSNESSTAENTNASVPARKSKYENLSQKKLTASSDENIADSYLNDFGFETKKPVRKPSGLEFQLYVTPSTSYRKLVEDNSRLNYTSPSALSVLLTPTANVNNSVHHTPALGIEIGAGVLYNLTRNFKIKTGLQFNIRQYNIDATQTYGMATIAFVQNNHLDSVSLFSMFGNSGANGYYSTTIDNKLYQISIPIGFQWDFLQGKKLGLSASASIQPTFTLNKNVYMISTDYKYYANGAPFFRKWNFNSSIDLNVTYKTGNVKWYVGPQIRYQHLPTYNDVYPIKEYRLDYGIKVGITTPIFK